ncbi:hypothetical protein ACGFZC_16015 [[Kitasatospora] papulosa]|uniref:hypothetical protein n=1 Tax=[Kitasatospora] papulosa TaxID=1464011 RepID=UPI00371C5AAC
MSSTLAIAQRKKAPTVIKGQADLLAEWREVGLITPSQFDTFTRTVPPVREGR